jgi:regulatory protein YycI of two-component signal transduction system YycFG
MTKTGIVLLIGMLLFTVLYPSVTADDTGNTVNQENVQISLTDKGLQVDESIIMANTGGQNVTSLRFWIQQNAADTTIVQTQSGKELPSLTAGNIRTCNLSAANLTIRASETLSITVTYFLPTTEQYFVQTLLYDTVSISIIYKDGTAELVLFQGEHLVSGTENNALQVRLYKPTEAPLNISILIIVFLVVLIVLASLLLILRRQRSKAKKGVVESEEMLTTKKSLLLSLLKDVEKQYRSQSISNETYTKIKEEYKAQAVDAMKKLDDLKK